MFKADSRPAATTASSQIVGTTLAKVASLYELRTPLGIMALEFMLRRARLDKATSPGSAPSACRP